MKVDDIFDMNQRLMAYKTWLVNYGLERGYATMQGEESQKFRVTMPVPETKGLPRRYVKRDVGADPVRAITMETAHDPLLLGPICWLSHCAFVTDGSSTTLIGRKSATLEAMRCYIDTRSICREKGGLDHARWFAVCMVLQREWYVYDEPAPGCWDLQDKLKDKIQLRRVQHRICEEFPELRVWDGASKVEVELNRFTSSLLVGGVVFTAGYYLSDQHKEDHAAWRATRRPSSVRKPPPPPRKV